MNDFFSRRRSRLLGSAGGVLLGKACAASKDRSVGKGGKVSDVRFVPASSVRSFSRRKGGRMYFRAGTSRISRERRQYPGLPAGTGRRRVPEARSHAGAWERSGVETIKRSRKTVADTTRAEPPLISPPWATGFATGSPPGSRTCAPVPGSPRPRSAGRFPPRWQRSPARRPA